MSHVLDDSAIECIRLVVRKVASAIQDPCVNLYVERDLSRHVAFMPANLLDDYGIKVDNDFLGEAFVLSKSPSQWRVRIIELRDERRARGSTS